MKVTFDSNVWQPVIKPEAYSSDADAASFAKIHAAVVAGQLMPFISRTIFTLEGIQRRARKELLGKYTPKVESKETVHHDTFRVEVSIRPDVEPHPGNNEHLARFLSAARELGFQLINVPRFGAIASKDVDDLLLPTIRTHEELFAYMDRASEAAAFIEALGCGMQPLYQVLSPYPRPYGASMYQWIASAPDSEAKRIAKAIAEWADGDSIAAHIAMGNDYFCTRDQAKGAGQRSILGAANVAALGQKYGFKTATPAALARLL